MKKNTHPFISPSSSRPKKMNAASEQRHAPEFRIWVTDTWYIRVDENGYVTSPSAEGSLGCVIELASIETEESRLALKIPRLLADTLRENAYICQLMDDERKTVLDQLSKNGGQYADGLMQAQILIAHPLSRSRQTAICKAKDGREQDGSFILVSFQPNKPPRFCVILNDSKLMVYPPNCQKDIERCLSIGEWEELKKTNGSDPPFRTCVFCESASPTGKSRVGELEDQLENSPKNEIWYGGIPSVIYSWSSGTLQEALSLGDTDSWTLRDYFELTDRILTGVKSLHLRNLIHADLRPANIFRVSGNEPKHYFVGDYGSFGTQLTAIGNNQHSSGNTTLGPTLGGYRASPFYAPERRSGVEFENANEAFVKTISDKGEIQYQITLRWRNAKSGRSNSNASLSEESSLIAGDRIRLRNYIFRVSHAPRIVEGELVLICDALIGRVMHDRLVVYEQHRHLKNGETISLSGYVEYRQWSAATDIYGVGLILLYSVFFGAQKSGHRSATLVKSGDEMFEEMREVLDSSPYFNHFWGVLTIFIREMTRWRDSEKPSDILNFPISVADNLTDDADPKNLYDFALKCTNLILQTTPNARIVFDGCNRNLVDFLFVMHFVLSCMHRSDSFRKTEPSVGAMYTMPFCESRIEKTNNAVAAIKALDRLVEIKTFPRNELDKMRVTDEDMEEKIAKFNTDSNLVVRLQLEKTKAKIEKIKKECLSGINPFVRKKHMLDLLNQPK